MKRLVPSVCAAMLFAAGPASAQVFGQFTPAHPVAGGNNLVGVYLLLGDRYDVGLLGQLRITSSPELNWGLQVGFADDPGDGALLLGGDVRYIFHRDNPDFPLDVAFDGGAGLTVGDDVTVIDFAPSLHYSHRFPLEGTSGALTPYGSLVLLIEHVSIDVPGAGDADDTDVDLVARFGLEWELSRKLQLIGELQVGNGTDFNTGVNIPF